MDSKKNTAFEGFLLNQPKFDQSTFLGRLRHFMDIIDPRTLLVSKAELQRSIKLLEDYKNNQLPSNTRVEDLWKAQKIKNAIYHPDTNEKIFPPFRMSGYVVFGSPVVVGLLLPNPSLAQTVFWQWLNQSHNACVNYANRNATKPTPTSRFVLGYTGAVTSAVGIAVGLNLLLKKAQSFSPATKTFISRYVPYPAVAVANVCNITLMRFTELDKGIEVSDSTGKVVGTSKIAAKKALKETALTRIIIPAPCLLLPPMIMQLIEKTGFFLKLPRMQLPVLAVVSTLSFALALPVAIAVFPQTSKVAVSKLEPEVVNATGEDFVFYNKGL